MNQWSATFILLVGEKVTLFSVLMLLIRNGRSQQTKHCQATLGRIMTAIQHYIPYMYLPSWQSLPDCRHLTMETAGIHNYSADVTTAVACKNAQWL